MCLWQGKFASLIFHKNEITDHEELISVSVAFLPVLQIHQRCGKNVFCFDGCHVKDGRKVNKMQILTCEIVDSTGTYLMLGCCVGFSENAENYGSLIDSIQFCGLNLNRGEFIMMSDRSKAFDSIFFQKLRSAKMRHCIQHLISNMKKNGINLTQQDENLIRTAARAITASDCRDAIDMLAQNNRPAKSYLESSEDQRWSSFVFLNQNISTFGIITNNPCESENNRLLPERNHSTVLDVCAGIFSKVAGSLNERKHNVLNLESREFPGFLATCMDPILKDARLGNLINPNPAYFIVEDVDSIERRYSVRHKSSNDRSNQKEVDLIKRTCDCRR